MVFIKRMRYRIRQWLARRYKLFPAIFRMSEHRGLVVRPDTEIVIEGFPRSANTFSVVAFSKSQSRVNVKIAHHLHAQAQVLRAVHWGIPVCVLIRKPWDAVHSFLVLYPELTAASALQAYIDFYSDILPVKDKVVVADFEVVTRDFGRIIANINQKFGTSFDLPAPSDSFEQDVFSEIESINKGYKHGKVTSLAIPSELKKSVGVVVSESSEPELLRQANNLYAQYCEGLS